MTILVNFLIYLFIFLLYNEFINYANGCDKLEKYKDSITKICTNAFYLTNIDTAFIDHSSKVIIDFGYTQLPELIRPYWLKMTELLALHSYNTDKDAIIHSTSYMTNFISVKVYCNSQYLGSIIIGPYLTEEPNFLMIENIILENKLSISLRNIINQYYLTLPLISSRKAKNIAEFIAYSAHNIDFIKNYTIGIGNKKYDFPSGLHAERSTIKQNTEQSLEIIEKNYTQENALLHAVETGDLEKLEELSEDRTLIINNFSDRFPNDPLRSGKNLAFVLNTLLRKAAEKGELPLIDIHGISEKYAVQIERTTSIHHLSDLIVKMRFEYCNAVRKMSLKDFNYLTKKVITYIRKNLDGDLRLETISNAINVNPTMLSREFKKDMKHNLNEYINSQRINEAIYIIENSKISITDLAYMVGFNDLNYFTKVFKKYTGVTPTEYRKKS